MYENKSPIPNKMTLNDVRYLGRVSLDESYSENTYKSRLVLVKANKIILTIFILHLTVSRVVLTTLTTNLILYTKHLFVSNTYIL